MSGSYSNSKSENPTTTNTSLTTKNLNVSGNSGLTAVGGENGSLSLGYTDASQRNLTSIDASTTTTTTTDFGAIDDAIGLSSHALDLVSAANRSSLSALSDANDTNAALAGVAISASGHAYGDALTAVQHNTDNTVSVIQTLATQFGTALSDFTSQEQNQLGNVVSALNSTYTANNTSANQQVINAVTQAGAQSSSLIKYVALVAVGGAVLYLVLRK